MDEHGIRASFSSSPCAKNVMYNYICVCVLYFCFLSERWCDVPIHVCASVILFILVFLVVDTMISYRGDDIQLMACQSFHQEQRQWNSQLKTWPSDQRMAHRAHLYTTQKTGSLSTNIRTQFPPQDKPSMCFFFILIMCIMT